MFRYRLRTLLVLLAVLPPLLWFGWTKYEAWKAEQDRLKAAAEMAAEMEAEIDRLLQAKMMSGPPSFSPPPGREPLIGDPPHQPDPPPVGSLPPNSL